MPPARILIIGGSTRAAADSVRRAGWQPICADLFADLDLRQTAEVVHVHNYPESIPDDVAQVRADGWFYCGALENRPDILQRMLGRHATYGPLLGVDPETIKLVRDPLWLAETMAMNGIPALRVTSESSPPPADGSWLQKPLASAGGRSIRIWNREATRVPLKEPHYFQQRMSGTGLSALFQFRNGMVEWLGGSREIEADIASRSESPFLYNGSCAPLRRIPITPDWTPSQLRIGVRVATQSAAANRLLIRGRVLFQSAIHRQLTEIASVLFKCAPGLKGLIGIDFRLSKGTVWVTEVNPRYTASTELLELTTGRSMLNPGVDRPFADFHSVMVKQILYARSTLTVPDLCRYSKHEDPWQMSRIADIPLPGTVVEAGWPICTVFGGGSDLPAANLSLQRSLQEVRSVLAD